ncbi:vanadium-dependent haloperoxidase [Roseiconus nitratireducens]|uniref:Vanadium-dependent haloperoxidase n=1 Tax=Roseiconus nitratireducens TaxID=2605748 RepID=A0A5M6D6F5_9BACT|nr:phosphatase PAP2 family protein [Roseiconus nitratireducens]KAA5543071.1 vanadium-dependent haloperoxidase [Roseiconus nitratireducens]
MNLLFEQLEPRRCMNAAWQNPALRCDVDGSSLVEPFDALQVINRLSRSEAGQLPSARGEGEPYYDTSGDGQLSPRDALAVINVLARYSDPLQLIVNTSPDLDPNANGVVQSPQVTFTGTTLPNVSMVANKSTGTPDSPTTLDKTQSDNDGNFVLQFDLQNGLNEIEVTAHDPRGREVSRSKSLRLGDVVLDWNAAALNVVREWTTTDDDPYGGRIVPSQPPRVAHNLAMIHTAMFDALNAIEGGYHPYLKGLSAEPGASPEAAAAAAAHRVASRLYPEADEMAHWDASLAESLASIPDGAAKDLGIVFGNDVGDAMLAARADDGSAAEIDYTPGADPGDWRRTLPGYLPPLLPQWRYVEPFAIEAVEQYRPEPPPELSSERYAESVDQVMQLGRLDSEVRTDDQSEIAIFWADGGGTFTPPGHWNQISADVALAKGTSLTENARLFSLLNIALADAGIAAWDAKYHYDLWRPIDAIRQADTDGNPATTPDPDWLPLVQNPPFPTYTSGHSSFSGAADAVLTEFFGSNVHFTSQLDGHNAPAQRPLAEELIVTRSFTSFTQAAEEAGMSRIYGGIHFDFDNTAGLQSGRAVGKHVMGTMLSATGYESRQNSFSAI